MILRGKGNLLRVGNWFGITSPALSFLGDQLEWGEWSSSVWAAAQYGGRVNGRCWNRV